MLHQSGGVQRPISSVFSLSFGQGHRGREGHGKEQGATSRPALDCSWCKAPSVRFDHPPPGLAGWLAHSTRAALRLLHRKVQLFAPLCSVKESDMFTQIFKQPKTLFVCFVLVPVPRTREPTYTERTGKWQSLMLCR